MHPRSRLLAYVLLALIVGGLYTLLRSRSDPEQTFTVRGVIRAPYADGEFTIQHEEIPGYMPAMTMPFRVDAAEVRDLSPGDRVEFEFRVRKDSSRATKFRKLGRAESNAEAPASRGAPLVRRLREGDAVPDFTLTRQDGAPITAADLRGRHTIVTFIFSRCPVPEFCPLIGRKFQALQRELPTIAKEVRLLSITIDPEYDQPAILREYGKSLDADFSRWSFATGSSAQIEQLARLFAVRIERNGGSLDHALATALIGPDANVIEIWRGNAWKPEEILARIRG